MNFDPVEKVIKLEIWYLGYSGTGGKSRSIRALFDYLDEKRIVEHIISPIGYSLGFNSVSIEYKNELWDLQINIYTDETESNLYHKKHPILLENVDGFVFVFDSSEWAYERNLKSWNKFISHHKHLRTSKPPIVFNFLKPYMTENIDPMTFLNEINYEELVDENIKSLIFFTAYLSNIEIIASFEKLLSLILSSNGMTMNMKLLDS